MDFPINLLPVETINEIVFLDVSWIIRIEADCKQTIIFNKDQEKPVRSIQSFGTLEEMLPPTFFFRCHRSHIINLSHLIRYDKSSRELYLTDGHVVIIAEDRVAEFLRSKRKRKS